MSLFEPLRPPPRTPILDQRTGRLTRDWEVFFRMLYERVGGANAQSNDDLSTDLFEDAGSSEMFATVLRVENDLQQAPGHIDQTQQGDQSPSAVPQMSQDIIDLSLEELRSLVMVLFSEVNALKQAIQS